MTFFSLRRMAAGLASLLAVSPAAAADSSTDILLSMELDVVFPRNESYLQPEILPISVAVRNYTNLPALGNFSFAWDLMPYSDGVTPGGVLYDSGYFGLPESMSTNQSDAVILVAYTNVTKWIYRKQYPTERLMLQVYAIWENMSPFCGNPLSGLNLGNIMFNIETYYEMRFYPNSSAIGANITDAPECPSPGAVVELAPYPSPTIVTTIGTETIQCTYSAVYTSPATGTSCAVTVDAAARSSISSQVDSMVTADILATQTTATTSAQPTKTNAAAARGPPLAPVLAAVGVVYCLVYT